MKLIEITSIDNVARILDKGGVGLALMDSPTYGFVVWASGVDTPKKLLHNNQHIELKDTRVKGYYEMRMRAVGSIEQAIAVLESILNVQITNEGTDQDYFLR